MRVDRQEGPRHRVLRLPTPRAAGAGTSSTAEGDPQGHDDRLGRRAYERHSLAGQELVRTLSESEGSQALRRYHFRPDDGLLVQARRRPGARIASGPAPYRYGTGEVAVFHTLRKRDR